MENKHKPTTPEEKAAMQQPYPYKRCPKTYILLYSAWNWNLGSSIYTVCAGLVKLNPSAMVHM